ncbi:MAG TPA: NapC/NirT family cytochrome c [Pyrinomonadaceae bacterium]|nr:NapC/NirT family cytochrome c [Pyrinomonadaceae bacterium]
MSEEKDNPPAEETPEPKVKLPSLLRNYISFIGGAIAIAALTSILLLIAIELFGREHDNPYAVLVTYILLPSILGFGIFIILVGMIFERRRRRKNPDIHMATYPILDLNDPARRRSLVVFLILGFLFLFMTAFGSYRAFEYTESVEFCGQQCHSVMKPEFVAYKATSHAQVRCVECHVGGGAEWYVRSKLNGMNQLYSVTFNSYSRPIKSPIHPPMRKANDTCGKCHWPEKFLGDELRTFNHFGFDEKNTLNQVRLLIKVGGGNAETGEVGGIHWHMNLANEITYIASDERRQDIPWVRMKDKNGRVVEYLDNTSKLTAQQIEQSEKRRMDCIDCHNRPAHNYLSPNAAVDQSLTAGKLDVSLPFIKAKAVEVLSAEYQTNDEAVAAIASGLDSYYRSAHADVYNGRQDAVRNAVAEVQRIYQTYFFPEMKTDWRAHFNNVGHFNAQGCFRCHDGQHTSKDGQVIRNDCAICHTTLDQTFGGKTIQPANGVYQHPVNLGDKNTWQCAACHKGDRSFKHPINLGDISQFQCAQCHTGGYEKVKY